MEMTVQDLLTILIRSFFLLLGMLSFLDYLRQREAIKRDIMFAVGSIALNTTINLIDLISPLPSSVKLIGRLSLLVQPLLFLRLSQHLLPVSPFLHRLALISMLLIWVLQLSPFENQLFQQLQTVSLILYFVLINSYVMLRFVQSFRKSSGILHECLALCAIGTGLLAIALLLLVPFYLLPESTTALRIPVQISFIIQENVFCCADPRLLSMVLQNLLGNAWKYSSKVEHTRIEFGTQENRLFVRDNDVGFNMAYAHKLFGAFQRLHGAMEFEIRSVKKWRLSWSVRFCS